MSIFQHRAPRSGSKDETATRQAAPREPRAGSLRALCKAKAEVIFTGETAHVLRSYLDPFRDK